MAWADALVCAQAFHWFATEVALGEIHRVLKPGGRPGLVWNVRDESVDWVAAITSAAQVQGAVQEAAYLRGIRRAHFHGWRRRKVRRAAPGKA